MGDGRAKGLSTIGDEGQAAVFTHTWWWWHACLHPWKFATWRFICGDLLYYNFILEKEMATHSSTLAWKIPWMEEPGRLQSMGSQRVRHDWATSLSLHFQSREKKKCQSLKECLQEWTCLSTPYCSDSPVSRGKPGQGATLGADPEMPQLEVISQRHPPHSIFMATMGQQKGKNKVPH